MGSSWARSDYSLLTSHWQRGITASPWNLIKILSEGTGKIKKPLGFLHFWAFLIYSHSTVAGGLLVMS